LIANHPCKAFDSFRAVTEGVPRVREIIREAQQRLATDGRGTILFCDEIHRFNKAQQDAFLPYVEEGVITLIGATTENPSFELNSALLSRLRVFVLQPLANEHIASIITRGIARLDEDARAGLELSPQALELLVRQSDGDARRALNLTEAVWLHARNALPRGAKEIRSEEHTSELQSRENLVCRLLLVKTTEACL